MSWREDISLGLIRNDAMAVRPERIADDGVIDNNKRAHILDGSDNILSLEWTPDSLNRLEMRTHVFGCIDSTNAVTVTLQGSWTFADGSNTIATFTAGDGMTVLVDSVNELVIVTSNNGVVLS